MLIGQLEETEPLAGEIESAVDTPELVFCLAGGPSLEDGGGIDDADRPALARLGRGGGERLSHQPSKPLPALTQAIEQCGVGHIGKPNRCSPCRGGPQTAIAQAIGKDHAQHVDGVYELPAAQKGLCFPCALPQGSRPAEALDGRQPVFVQKRLLSHAILESDSILLGKLFILAPMGSSPRDSPCARRLSELRPGRRNAVQPDKETFRSP